MLSTDVKASPEFKELATQSRREGFDPSLRRHVSEFNLNHPNAFRTLTADELSADGPSPPTPHRFACVWERLQPRMPLRWARNRG